MLKALVLALALGLGFAQEDPASCSIAEPCEAFNLEALNQEAKDMRLKHLEEQAMWALKSAVETHEHPVFPNALIAGDCVITHLLDRLGFLKDGRVRVMVVDTFHLFPETMEFLSEVEEFYNFKADVFQANGCPDKAAFDRKYGANLWQVNIEQYDKVCKVEPFQRGLKTLETDVMINGRTRWQGNERAYIGLFENAPIGGGLAKVNPLAYWTLEDTFDYIAKYRVPHHPLHADGYPSIGDAKDTIRVPEDGSTRFVDFQFEGDRSKWLDYASERKGRFVGLQNKDGTTKTECGIHVAGAERTFERDLWDASADSKVITLTTQEEVLAYKNSEEKSILVVYAPWCPFCQKMEEEYEKLAEQIGDKVKVLKFRGDEEREFVRDELNAKTFPTINVLGKGKAVKYFSEMRDVESLKDFVEQN